MRTGPRESKHFCEFKNLIEPSTASHYSPTEL